MTLLTFARRTSPFAFYAIPAVTIGGSVFCVLNDEAPQVPAVAGWGVALFLAYLLGTALHRQRLAATIMRNYFGGHFHNSHEYGHRTPSKAVGMEFVNYANRNPLEAWKQ